MHVDFVDYNGPTGLSVATSVGCFPMNSVQGATALVASGAQGGTIDPGQSAAIKAAADKQINSAK